MSDINKARQLGDMGLSADKKGYHGKALDHYKSALEVYLPLVRQSMYNFLKFCECEYYAIKYTHASLLRSFNVFVSETGIHDSWSGNEGN